MKTLLVEIARDSRHYVVSMPETCGHISTIEDVIESLSFSVVQFATVIIDPDRRIFIKARIKSRGVSQHELDWFVRGDVHYVTIAEMKKIVKKVYY